MSVKSLVDEIILIDTGSTDNTKKTALDFGAKIFDYDWDDNFSNARNYSLSKASGEWILVLDADEVASYTSRESVMKLLSDDKFNGYYVRIVNLMGAPPNFETCEDLVVRLFRNRPEFFFTGIIHEQVKHAIISTGGEESLGTATFNIYHDGYTNEIVSQKAKVARNSSVICKALQTDPDNPFLLYSLGSEYFLSQDYVKARDFFTEAISKISLGEGYLSDLLFKTGLCLYMLGDSHEIRNLLTNYSGRLENAPEILFFSGLVNLAQGDLDTAEKEIRECLACFDSNSQLHLNIKDYQVYQALAEICEAKGDFPEGARFYLAAVKVKNDYIYPLSQLVTLYRGNPDLDSIPEDLGECYGYTALYQLLAKLDWNTAPDAAALLLSVFCHKIISHGQSNGTEHKLVPEDMLLLVQEKFSTLRSFHLKTTAALAGVLLSLGSSHFRLTADGGPDKMLELLNETLMLPAGENRT